MLRKLTKTQKLAILFGLIATSPASAQIVDLETAPLSRPHQTERGRDVALTQFALQDPSLQDPSLQAPFLPDANLPGANLQDPALPAPAAPQAAPAQPPALQQPPALPTTPNTPIDQLTQPPQLPAAANNAGFGGFPPALGATAGSFASAPNMIGDFFGGGFSFFQASQTVDYAFYAPGDIIAINPNTIIAFEVGNDIVPNDIFTTGPGFDLSGSPDGLDTFGILEPIPPSDAPTAPGPGFVFDGGTATYTNNNSSTTPQPGLPQSGELWFIQYSYTTSINGDGGGGSIPGSVRGFVPVPAPGISARRVKISENFSPEVRDRYFMNYSFFNDAYGGLGDISRYIYGVERVLVDDIFSIETRLPAAGTYGSFQAIDQPESRNFELGNASFIGKAVLVRTPNMLFTGGLGVTVPTADDTRLTRGNREILRIENESIHLLPFAATLFRLSPKTFLQAYMQIDVATNGDPVLANLTGGALRDIGSFTDSTLMHLDVAVNRELYHNPKARWLRRVIGNAELHYTGTLEDSDVVAGEGVTFSSLAAHFNIVNATSGLHLQMGDHIVVTPAMSIPLRDGLDKQFDYEAIVQLNYIP